MIPLIIYAQLSILVCITEGDIMRTTLDLPESLLSEAMRVTHTETKTAVIVLALEELIQKSKIAELKRYKGKIELGIDLDEIRARR